MELLSRNDGGKNTCRRFRAAWWFMQHHDPVSRKLCNSARARRGAAATQQPYPCRPRKHLTNTLDTLYNLPNSPRLEVDHSYG